MSDERNDATHGRAMRLLLINPNTSESLTRLVVDTARTFAAPTTEITGATGRFGARYITTRAASVIAGHAGLEAYAEHGDGADGVVLACFGDPGLAGLKEVASQPVVGMAEASCLMAATFGGRFAIVTGGERWGPMLEEFVAAMGMKDRLAGVRTVAPSGGDIARDPDRALGLLADAARGCVTELKADSVILAGAGLAGIAARIADRVPVPLIDSVAAAVGMAEAMVSLKTKKASAGAYATTARVETVGISAKLAAKMG